MRVRHPIDGLTDRFYRPTSQRFKILYEYRPFPSDQVPRRLRSSPLTQQYAFETQVAHHGLDLDTALVPLRARDGEHLLRTEDIIAAIEREGDSLALVMFSGIQYYTGQLFDMRAITAAGHKAGAVVGWDLAHAVGNVPLEVRHTRALRADHQLHDIGCDWAVFCSYKYLNSGAGGVAGLFVHSKHTRPDATPLPRLAGWYGHQPETRFGELSIRTSR